MKILKVVLLLPIFLFFYGNAVAMEHSSHHENADVVKCSGSPHDVDSSTTSGTKPETKSHHQNSAQHEKDCHKKSCSMKSCCVGHAMQAAAVSFEINTTVSSIPQILDRLVLSGSEESVYHPPLLFS